MLGATDTSNGPDSRPCRNGPGKFNRFTQPLLQVFENGQRIFRKVHASRVNEQTSPFSRLGKTRWSRQAIRGLP